MDEPIPRTSYAEPSSWAKSHAGAGRKWPRTWYSREPGRGPGSVRTGHLVHPAVAGTEPAGRGTRASNDMVEILRAELCCLRKVEIRETDELATPATIGWRRPLLLLPADWREWNPAERRAVLAHELAHVCRGDFLTGLLAQASLTLHFYNPLAHWLAAPAAAGARARGRRLGRPSCRRHAIVSRDAGPDGPAPRQPRPDLAGPCFPSLSWHLCSENRNAEKHESNPPCSSASSARLITVGVLSVLGLLVAGVRGPAGIVDRAGQPQQPAAVAGRKRPPTSRTI